MRVDRRVSPNQTALWTIYDLRNDAGQRRDRVLLACYYGRSTGDNGGHSCHPAAQVRAVELGDPPIFQAGHAGSIPVTRSICKRQVVDVAWCRSDTCRVLTSVRGLRADLDPGGRARRVAGVKVHHASYADT
jgi:hypothetical protein